MCNNSVNFRSFSWQPSILQVCITRSTVGSNIKHWIAEDGSTIFVPLHACECWLHFASLAPRTWLTHKGSILPFVIYIWHLQTLTPELVIGFPCAWEILLGNYYAPGIPVGKCIIIGLVCAFLDVFVLPLNVPNNIFILFTLLKAA